MSELNDFNIFVGALISVATIFLVIILLISLSIFLVLKDDTKIVVYKNGTEVNKIMACCMDVKNTNFFENKTDEYNVGKTGFMKYHDEKMFCVPEGNLEHIKVPCKTIKKEDITKEWMDWNAECLECYDKETNSMTLDGCSFEYDECFKYKFGDYFIEIK